MSNTDSVTEETAGEAERKVASAGLQLMLARQKVAGCRDLEEAAYDLYAASKTDRNLRTWKFAELALRRAEAEANLAWLQMEAVSP